MALQAVLSVVGRRPVSNSTEARGKPAALNGNGSAAAASVHDSFLADAARLMNKPRR